MPTRKIIIKTERTANFRQLNNIQFNIYLGYFLVHGEVDNATQFMFLQKQNLFQILVFFLLKPCFVVRESTLS